VRKVKKSFMLPMYAAYYKYNALSPVEFYKNPVTVCLIGIQPPDVDQHYTF
jgi:hypothetical protein